MVRLNERGQRHFSQQLSLMRKRHSLYFLTLTAILTYLKPSMVMILTLSDTLTILDTIGIIQQTSMKVNL